MNIDQIILPKSSQGSGLLELLEDRQKYILSKMPSFFKNTIIIALVGFVITFILQWITNSLPPDRYGLVSLTQPTLGSIMAVILSLLSVLIMWVFVIWSLFFIPFVSYNAYKAAQHSRLPIGNKPFRWVQLYATTFLPMSIFAIAWSSYATEASNFTTRLAGVTDFVIVIFGAILVAVIIWGANLLVPSRLLALRLALFSTLLYATLFIAYGGGYSLASYAMLFGILGYLTFDQEKIEELGRRIATYDLDSRVAEQLNDIAIKNQKLQSTQDEINAKEAELQTKYKLQEQEIRSLNVENQLELQVQLSSIKKEKAVFNRQSNEALLMLFQQKANLINNMYSVLSSELSDRMDEQIPKRIKDLQENAKSYDPLELQNKMQELMDEMNNGLKALPEGLKALQCEMLETAKQIEAQTNLLLEEDEKDSYNERQLKET